MLKTQASKAMGQNLIPHVAKQFYPAPAGSVLYLPGYPPGESTIYDKSLQAEAGTPNNGTIVGATWTRHSSGLWILNLDGGDDYVTCGIGASLNLSTAIDMQCWLYLNVVFSALIPDYPAVMGKVGYWYFWGIGDGGANDDKVATIIKDVDSGVHQIVGSALSALTWYHIRVTYNGTIQQFYINDVQQGAGLSWSKNILPSAAIPFILSAYAVNTGTNCKIALSKVSNTVGTSSYQQERRLFGSVI